MTTTAVADCFLGTPVRNRPILAGGRLPIDRNGPRTNTDKRRHTSTDFDTRQPTLTMTNCQALGCNVRAEPQEPADPRRGQCHKQLSAIDAHNAIRNEQWRIEQRSTRRFRGRRSIVRWSIGMRSAKAGRGREPSTAQSKQRLLAAARFRLCLWL